MNKNPFTFGNPIRDPSRFFGRKDAIRQIVNRLMSSAHESTSIVGERRIGKTSLLNYLSNPDAAASLGLSTDRYCLVYIDFQGLTDITPQRFWQRVLRKLANTVADANLAKEIRTVAKMESFDIFDLEDMFEIISTKGLTVVLLMDEFEYVTQNSKFKEDFFGGLRALAIHQNLALIPSTRRELVDLCHSEELKGSPFFNIFANVVLRPFSEGEVRELMRGYMVATEIVLSDEDETFIINLAGGYPFFVQMAGNYLVEAKLHETPQDHSYQRATADFEEQVDPHYSYMWTHCSESEKITLLAVIALSNQKPSNKTLPNMENLSKIHARAQIDIPALVKRGLLLEDEKNSFRLLSPILERWIMREIAAIPGEEESERSVAEWLHAGGKEDLTLVKGALPKIKKKYWPVVSSVIKDVSFEIAGAALFEILLKTLT
ncbi:MAG: AAA-like domain-containing protein [Anaerolineaceae bacterium]|nr:AAA-like domain-containing protein [Anaerolineaceae bacterium]